MNGTEQLNGTDWFGHIAGIVLMWAVGLGCLVGMLWTIWLVSGGVV